MGMNRSFPQSSRRARRVLDIAPEWVLAEHGGPFEFNAEDFKRRVRQGNTAARPRATPSARPAPARDWD